MTDSIVIGGGLAGLSTALELAEIGRVFVLTKCPLMHSSSAEAQGGIAAAIAPDDSPKLHGIDTLSSGREMSRQSAVEILVNDAPDCIKRLKKFGLKIDPSNLAREGGHGKNRIVHTGGDSTGEDILSLFRDRVLDNPRIILIENAFAFDIIVRDGCCEGVKFFDQYNNFYQITAPVVVLATGGIGAIFRFTTNPDLNTGDGIALAYRAGARLTDMEFVQFHPTAFAGKGHSTFLISETVRGEGAVLRNSSGQRFMDKYSTMGELAPRDVVARSIYLEMRETGTDCVFLDCTEMGRGFLTHRFPKIYSFCREAGFNMDSDLIPVRPAAHFIMGGVATDLWGRTSIANFLACGETACTGVHGANRLASNSLLEALVFSTRASRYVTENIRASSRAEVKKLPDLKGDGEEFEREGGPEIREKLLRSVYSSLNIVREKEELTKLLRFLDTFQGRFWGHTRAGFELDNMCTVAALIARAALLREESRGAHNRLEFPDEFERWTGMHIFLEHGKDVRITEWT